MISWVQMSGMALFALLMIAILVLVALSYNRSTKNGKCCKSGSSTRSCSSPYGGSSSSSTSSIGLGYAVLSNQDPIVTGSSNVNWAATPAANLIGGISLDSTTGVVTLPPGKFLVQYSVRFTRTPWDSPVTATAQLQQTVNGVATNISQPAIVNVSANDGIQETIPLTPHMITGTAIVTVNSDLNNALTLVVSTAPNLTLPTATGTDANAQLTILPLSD